MSVLTKLVLRKIVDADLAALFEFHQEREGYEMAVVVPRTEADFYRHWRETILCNPHGVARLIELDGEVVGDIVSFNKDGMRMVGYWIGKKFWGRGIMSQALGRFITLHDPTRPLYAFVALTNPASFRVLEKCGFKQVGNPVPASDGVVEYQFQLL